MGGLPQAGLLMELGFPSGKRGGEPCMWVGGGLLQPDSLFSPVSRVERSRPNSLRFGDGGIRGLFILSPHTRKQVPYHP